MKFILVGDSHYTNRKPSCRRDSDYQQTCLNKWFQVFYLAREYGAYILQAGDLVDSARLSIGAVTPLIRMFFNDEDSVHTVPGQHDLWYHNPDLTNTPMGLMEAVGAVSILSETPVRLINAPEAVDVYGAGWGSEIPTIQDPEAFNVLVTHRMVVQDTDNLVYTQQEEFETGHALLRHTKFDLILTGDNHQKFSIQQGTRWLINPGSMMRSTITQYEHKPTVFIFDTETHVCEEHILDHYVAEACMDLAAAEVERADNERLETFIAGLQEDRNATLDFRANLDRALAGESGKKLTDAVRHLILDIVREG